MIKIFKTRHELRELRREVKHHNDIMDALRAHFDLKYTMEDFQRYFDDVVASGTVQAEQIKEIPVSVGEFLHLYEMLSPVLKTYFRGVEVKPVSNTAVITAASTDDKPSKTSQNATKIKDM